MNLDKISEEAYGFSGAQLESVMNEAAIYMMREELTEVEQRHLSMAIDKVMMGEKTDRETNHEEKNGWRSTNWDMPLWQSCCVREVLVRLR